MKKQSRRVNFVLTESNASMLDTYKSYVPFGFRFSLSELLNSLIKTHLESELVRLDNEANQSHGE